MKTMGLGLVVLWFVAACAGSAAPDANTPDSANVPEGHTEAPAVSGYESHVDTCSERPCGVSSECCEGYSCGFDPERSRVQRYCMPG